jgi:hypothetical protein
MIKLFFLLVFVYCVFRPTRKAVADTGDVFPRTKRTLPTRQIHLDFHTSEHIPDIGKQFDKKQWQGALKAGHVNSINIFAKGHHGWSYYPTDVGTIHPHLDFDLLGSQIEACHEIGVECPVYYTIGWSANDAETHPEWCARRRDGSFVWRGKEDAQASDPFPEFTWKLLCPSGGYHEHIKQQVTELCQRYPLDGLWFDIYQLFEGCCCARCTASMEKKGIDPDDPEAVIEHFAEIYKTHMADIRKTIAEYHPNAYVFYNGTTFISGRGENLLHGVYKHNTHQDLEDLPTAWGGYDKFPFRAKFYLDQGYQICAMSGKFHTAWGEFGGFKHSDAIHFEAASMIAFGSNCNFGDQLHPSGAMDMQTYRNIGKAYEYVEQIEEYGPGGIPVSNLGLWPCGNTDIDEGAYKMLLDLQMDFLIAHEDNLDTFKLVVIPSHPCLNDDQVKRIEQYMANGGKVFCIAEGAMDKERKRFVLDVGADFEGMGNYDIDYTAVRPELGEELMQSPVLNYSPTLRCTPHSSTEILADVHEPYFSRTYEHYCSHQNTANRPEKAAHPALIQKGNLIFSASPLDLMYMNRAARAHRDFFEAALKRLYTEPMLNVDLPSCGRVSLLHQADKKRYVAHLLYATPHLRGGLELIEDLLPVYEVPVELRVSEKITNVTLIPDNVDLKWEQQDGRTTVVVPRFRIHCAVVFEY